VPEEDDRTRDASSAADPSWAEVVVPDDIRELAGDVAAYHRELRARERRARLGRILRHRRALPLMLVTASLAVAGLVAAMLTSFIHQPVDPAPSALPVATTTVAPGHVGGLLPAVTLHAAGGGSVSSRSAVLRPAVLLLIGPSFNDTNLVTAMNGEADSERIPLDIVVSAASAGYAAGLPALMHRGTTAVYFDPAGVIANGVSASGPTAVVVDRDGRIADPPLPVTASSADVIGAQLQSMLFATGSSG
jgi:hypothetical protein